MFDIFNNKLEKNTAKITIENKGKNYDLYYHLYDYPVQHQWQNIHKQGNGVISGTTYCIDIDTAVKEINSLIDVPLPRKFNQTDLNSLHEKFVDSKMSKNWLRVNELIHILEGKISNLFHRFDSSINFYCEREQFIPIKDEYKLFLRADSYWGDLYLGYATLGKDWIDISGNDDTDRDLNIQKFITSEALLNFSMDQPFKVFQEIKLYNWAKKTSINVPLNNLNDLSFGRYPLGHIIINSTLLDFHNEARDWYVPNHWCKLKWNSEFLDPSFSILNIEFFDSSFYIDSLKEHANLYDTLDQFISTSNPN